MSRVIIYPSNAVTIDGIRVLWTEADFRRRKIDLVRYTPTKPDDAEQRMIGEDLYIIFATDNEAARQRNETRIKNAKKTQEYLKKRKENTP